MDLDENICLCFHVSLRKVKKFIRLERPVRASQISQCYGAGTGCGWCRPFLEKLLADAQNEEKVATESQAKSEAETEARRTQQTDGQTADASKSGAAAQTPSLQQMTPQQYAEMRRSYVGQGKGEPPAT